MFDSSSPFALFDDNLDKRGDLLLSDLDEHIACKGPADVAAAFKAIAAAQARGHWVAIAASYELGYALEPKVPPRPTADDGPLLEAWVFRRAERMTETATSAALDQALDRLSEEERVSGVASIAPDLSEPDYFASVARIRELIEAGDCYQVNYTLALRGEAYGDPLALYRRLRRSQPVRYGTFIRHGGGAILSRSPELFVERDGATLTCRPMKGTAPRSAPSTALAASEKNRAENVMIVDLLRNDLARLGPAGGVTVTRLCEVEAYPSVWQMTSTVVAESVHADLEAVFRALFPCGSITGAPKIRAMQIIRELEPHARGLYCGALGWLSPNGDFRFSVPIRTVEVDADGKARMGIGSGIVADSDLAGEWAECMLKGRFLTGLDAEFSLIETLRCEPGSAAPYPLLELHLERLVASGSRFGFRFDLSSIRAALLTEAGVLSRAHRVRLQLDPPGRFVIKSTPLESAVADEVPSVVVSPLRISSRNPLRHHKTTARGTYDRELARVTEAGHFDALFINERDELAEGARTNVFLDTGDGPLATPPLASGALDGVFRRKLLRDGRATERRLTVRDLLDANTIYVANAVRGLVRVELVGRDQLR